MAFGRGANGAEAIVFQTALPPLTIGGHDYLEQLARWMAGALAPAISRGRVAIVDRAYAEKLLDGLTIAGGAELLGDNAGWADRFVRFLTDNAENIVELSEGRPALGDIPQEDTDVSPPTLRLRSSIGAPDVARPIDIAAGASDAAAFVLELERDIRAAALELSGLLDALEHGGSIDEPTRGTLEDIERRLVDALEAFATGNSVLPTAVAGETPAEHIANALMILRGAEQEIAGLDGAGFHLSGADYRRLEDRLVRALDRLRSAGR